MKICDYFEELPATRVMQHRTISRMLKTGRKIQDSLDEPSKYWCNKCWNKYGK